MHFRAIAERPSATPRAGTSWLLLGFVALSLSVHALFFIPDKQQHPLNTLALGTPAIHVTLGKQPAKNQTQPKPATETPARKTTPATRTSQKEITVAPTAKQSPAAMPAQRAPTTTPRLATLHTPPSTLTRQATPAPAVAATTDIHHRITLTTTANAPAQKNSTANEAEQREALRNFLLGELRDQLSRYLTYPQRARRRGWEGEVLLEMNVSTQGRLQNIQLVRSSGYAPLDRSAMKSLARIDRLTLPEKTTLQHAVNLQLPVIYRLSSD